MTTGWAAGGVRDLALGGLEWEVVLPLGADGRGPWVQCATERDAVIQNLRTILSVEPGEWPLRPLLGTPFSALLDDPSNERTINVARAMIRGQIEQWERRLEVLDLQVEITQRTVVVGGVNVDQTALIVQIYGVIKATGEILQTSLSTSFNG